jgi:quinolinate synthase
MGSWQTRKGVFFPDQHLGRWTGYLMDIPLAEMLVWDPDEPMGGLTPQQIKMAKILLWKGTARCIRCSRHSTCCAGVSRTPSGMVISHPECNFEVCKAFGLRRLDRFHHQDDRVERARARAGSSAPS